MVGEEKKEKWELCESEVDVVNQFKYLGYWFSTGNRYGKHLQNVIGKAQKAVNTVWGVMKRAKIDTLKERLLLMDSLVKAGALYGVEIWGWRRREGIGKLQGKFVKMALGVARNTPDYISKLEAGKRSLEIETRRRAGKYIVGILKMKKDRWPKVCLREEIRGIINRNPSQWRREFK